MTRWMRKKKRDERNRKSGQMEKKGKNNNVIFRAMCFLVFSLAADRKAVSRIKLLCAAFDSLY